MEVLIVSRRRSAPSHNITAEETEALLSIAEAIEQLSDVTKFVEQIGESPDRDVFEADAENTDAEDEEEKRAARHAPGIDASPLRNLLELAVLFVLVASAEHVLNSGRIGSFGVHPHPYWLLVLPAAAARGVGAGLLAAGFATALYAVGAHNALHPDTWSELLDSSIMLEPLLIGFAAYLVGHFRDESLARYRTLWRHFRHLREINEYILEHNNLLNAANAEFKAKLLDHSAQFGNLIDIARRLESATKTEIFDLTLKMVRDHCGASVCSILLPREDGKFELAAEIGWNPQFIEEKLNDAAESLLVVSVMRTGARISGFDADAPPPGLGPLLVAPLFDAEMRLSTLICLDQLPAEQISHSTASLFFGIADWAESSLTQLGSTERPAAEINALTRRQPWLGEPRDLGHQLSIEDARCTRLGLVASIVAIRATSRFGTGPYMEEELGKHLLRCLGTIIRSTDSMFRFGYPGCYAILLAGTPAEGAAVFRERLTKWLDYLGGDEIEDYSVRVFHPTEKTPNIVSVLDDMTEYFCAMGPAGMDQRCPVPVPHTHSLGNLQDFLRRMRLEMGLAMRYKHELFLVCLVVGNAADGTLESFRDHALRYAQRALRATDGIYELREHHFALVLPGGGTRGAFTIEADFTAEMRPHLPEKLREHLTTQVFAAHGGKSEMDHLLDVLLKLDIATTPGVTA